MNLIEVDNIGLQPPETCLTFASNRFALKRSTDLPTAVPHALAFREDVWARRSPLKSSGNNLLRMAEPIQCCGINPVKAIVQGRVNGGNGIVFVLAAHAAVPPSAADGPGADSDRRNLKIAVPQLTSF